ncbi:GNAT family N-acetyltransferase [Alkalihalobacillus sp. CinArs1]|uniref:GNAT family N-acetyltransferase n=1 Tax=Alkalihalobacillus sp. CinArs1 TaxID=2995314 RepID=UPI0022DD124F|nr:GNAT family N-acetyltransferase [Alkalihalobacillus sp. CinArs1]
MIRRLTEADHKACISLLTPYAAENLFILGDIEAFGYDQPFQKLWGDFSSEGELRAVLLKYEKNYIPFASNEFDAAGFASIISEDQDFLMVSGLERVTEQVEAHITHPVKSKRKMYYAKCDNVEKLSLTNLEDVRIATTEDIPSIHDLHNAIDEFNSSETVEEKQRNLDKGISRTYYMTIDGQVVTAASTAAENSQSAMIVGVCTRPGFKRKGYATKCMMKLCYDVLTEGKDLCLFYDNPEAGNIYKRIGFREIEKWTMSTFETKFAMKL